MNETTLGAGPASAQAARAAIALYPISSRSCAELVRYGENTTYHVTDGQHSLALRLARVGYQSRASIEAEMTWMSALREHGVDTPAAFRGRDGELVQQLKLSNGRVQLVVAFEWVEGVPLPEVAGLDPWRRLGQIMAQVHEHGRRWSPPAGFTRPAWDLDALVGDWPRWGTPVPDGVWSAHDGQAILDARAAVRERLQRLGTGPSRFGLIHSDLGFENVLVGPAGHTVVIDFDDSGPGWYLYELASALYPLEGTPGFRARRELLAAGYRDVAPLPDEDVGELPTFLMCRRLATLGWTFSRGDTPHAGRQRAHRLATTPGAVRRFLKWHRAHPALQRA
ncbi:MAG: phosphotransferase [Solirubrobacterales bacterium]|nr:phosphotransferase [Solirubrobacterales bacterium]